MQFPVEGDLQTILYLVFYGFFFIYIIFAQRIQMWQWTKQVEAGLQRLELFYTKGKKITIKTIKEVSKSEEDPTNAINEFLEFFTIEPVDRDPAGVLNRLEHIVNVRDNRFEAQVRRLAPNVPDYEVQNLENLLEAAMAVYIIFKIVRHYLILAKKSKSQIFILQLQMQMPEILRIASAYFEALRTFSEGKPIGDSIGPFIVAVLANNERNKGNPVKEIKNYTKETLVYELDYEKRHLYLIRAQGPGGTVGKPGEAIKKIVEENKGKIKRIITIDAALRLEGETSGEIAEGVGAAIGGFGIEKFKMEDTGVKYEIPIDAIIVKQTIEEAVTSLRKEIAESVDKVLEKVRRAILERTEPGDSVIVAGIGNTIGVGI
ncbi:MAG: DUF1512 domain-containing protein [Candidatus Odinarchaeia archaeon]